MSGVLNSDRDVLLTASVANPKKLLEKVKNQLSRRADYLAKVHAQFKTAELKTGSFCNGPVTYGEIGKISVIFLNVSIFVDSSQEKSHVQSIGSNRSDIRWRGAGCGVGLRDVCRTRAGNDATR